MEHLSKMSRKITTSPSRFALKMFRLTPVLVLCLAAAALGKVRTSKRPGFMMGNPLYDPVWEDDLKVVGGEEVVPGSRPYQLSFQERQ